MCVGASGVNLGERGGGKTERHGRICSCGGVLYKRRINQKKKAMTLVFFSYILLSIKTKDEGIVNPRKKNNF